MHHKVPTTPAFWSINAAQYIAQLDMHADLLEDHVLHAELTESLELTSGTDQGGMCITYMDASSRCLASILQPSMS